MPHRIFIVEDHPVMLDAYETVLGLEPDLEPCGTAASAEEAIVLLADLDCDLVMVDYRLPGQSGADLVRHLRATHPDLPAVMISAHEEDTFVQEALEAGAAAFVTKRDLLETLVPTILAVLAERRHVALCDPA